MQIFFSFLPIFFCVWLFPFPLIFHLPFPLFFLSSQTADTCELLCIIIQNLDYVLERRCGFSMDISQSLVAQGG